MVSAGKSNLIAGLVVVAAAVGNPQLRLIPDDLPDFELIASVVSKYRPIP